MRRHASLHHRRPLRPFPNLLALGVCSFLLLGASLAAELSPHPAVAGAGTSAPSPSTRFVAAASPSNRLSVTTPVASPNPAEVGDPTVANVSASGGIGPYQFSWNGLPPGCDGSNASRIACNATQAGTYDVFVTVSDTAGHSAASGNLTLVINERVLTAINESVATGAAPLPVIFSLVIHGGVGPFAAAWSFGDGTVGNGLNVGHVYTAPQVYSITAVLTDALGASSRTSINITVIPAASSTPPASTGPSHSTTASVMPVVVSLGTAFLLVACGVLLGWWIRQRRLRAVPPLPKEIPPTSSNPYIPPPR